MKNLISPVTLSILSALTLLLQPDQVSAGSWEQAIEAAEETSQEYWDAAMERGSGFPGTAYNEIGIDEHECAILGRMLKKSDLILHLEFIDRPDIQEAKSEEEVQYLLVTSILFSNWAHTARRILDLTDGERIVVWNLDCVGKMEIPDDAFVPETETAFRISETSLTVLGEIRPGFFEDFSKVLNDNPDIEDVFLGSGGGSVWDAIQAGLLIRSKGINTSLYADCLSACPLIFLGGAMDRIIWSPYPRLGFHRVSVEDVPVSDSDPVYELIYRYVKRLGADPSFVIRAMQSASIEGMYFPEPDDLCQSNFVTAVQRGCFSPGR